MFDIKIDNIIHMFNIQIIPSITVKLYLKCYSKTKLYVAIYSKDISYTYMYLFLKYNI